jgi:hypothetical protein
MEWVITIECCLAGQVLHRTDTVTRHHTPLRPEHVGLTLRDCKTVLNVIQRAVVTDQVEVSCRRYHRCTCRGGRPGVEWLLAGAMPSRATREYAYLLASGAPGCRIDGPRP